MSEYKWTAKQTSLGWYVDTQEFYAGNMEQDVALLIAAAPKLLAALKGLFGPSGLQATSERIEAAQVAIAEAEEPSNGSR